MNQVLVVEDEEIIRNALKRLLERHDYEVFEAGTVKESLETVSYTHLTLPTKA